ncbi:MAG: hypothetical protein L6264_04910 [Weeksellaceae bacterium]|nr:hypothetical protein [Bacteroidota bacterium]MCG2780269.1 hypothetical protein [Weeksellaceae bacterium]
MKKLYKLGVFALVILTFTGCNDRFDGDEILNTDAVKIDSVKVAQDTMDVFTIQTIKTFSNYTANCEGFYGYDYFHTSQTERRVTSYKFKTSAACGNAVAKASQINFRPQQTGTFTFKFWNGKNAAGENMWIEKNIVVK